MSRFSRVDANQSKIVAALRKIGCSVLHLHTLGDGAPDLAIGYRGRNLLLELKDGKKAPSARKLTPDEEIFHRDWRGQVATVESVEEAIKFVISWGVE